MHDQFSHHALALTILAIKAVFSDLRTIFDDLGSKHLEFRFFFFGDEPFVICLFARLELIMLVKPD